MCDKQIDIIYELDKMVENVLNFENMINTEYSLERFVLNLSFESGHIENDFIVRLTLGNTISSRSFNNGILYFFHKVFYMSDIDNYNENEIILKFFSIQKNLKNLKINFEISDNRKENE